MELSRLAPLSETRSKPPLAWRTTVKPELHAAQRLAVRARRKPQAAGSVAVNGSVATIARHTSPPDTERQHQPSVESEARCEAGCEPVVSAAHGMRTSRPLHPLSPLPAASGS
jgi:hypothetical protein